MIYATIENLAEVRFMKPSGGGRCEKYKMNTNMTIIRPEVLKQFETPVNEL